MGGDYSKQAFKADNLYSDVLMQQGKVQLDSDWNEQAAIQFRRKRAQTIDTIGRAVVPRETQNGFWITSDGGSGLLIHPGRMYVDGLLAENRGRLFDDSGTAFTKIFDATLDEKKTAEPFPYANQPYLIFNAGDEVLPAIPYLVYLDVWQREVTHLKDPDIIETAVGFDTTTRMQTIWQVKTRAITTTTDPECPDALAEWDSVIAPSAARLTTDTVAVNTDPDPCLIPPGGGYRGLENRLYRIEIHQGGLPGTATFKWARHNGSVATAITHIDGSELTVVQSQWDELRRFEVGDWVEITDNKLEFAGLPGEMAKVDDVDYAANTITLTGVLSGDFPSSGTDNATDSTRHTRIRKWDQSGVVRDTAGAVVTNLPSSTDGLIDVPASTRSVVLEDGITVTFDLEPGSGEFKVGDYWLFTARSGDASLELLDKAPPEGIHHHYAWLAIVTASGIEDCRIHWPPEFQDQTCCTVTVGDDVHSRGDYQTIQAAMNSLPTTGGKVCVLPGEYNEDNIVIDNLDNIIIEGCGTRSKVISPVPTGGGAGTAPVFHVTDSTSIRIASLEIEASDLANGILLEETTAGALQDIELHDLHITAATRSAIDVRLGSDIVIQNCRIDMRDQVSDWPGIFVAAERALIKQNSIMVAPGQGPAGATAISLGRGGIQIGNTSDDVRVIDNLIQGGIGNGITLGSLTAAVATDSGAAAGQWVGWVDDPGSGAYESIGMLSDIRIENNRILDMGLNGIGVAAFFNLDAVDEFISVEGLDISGNEIRGCLNQPLLQIADDMVGSKGYGGIALADVEMLSIQHNVIEGNGEARDRAPVCGIYVLHAEGAEVSDNRIINNGQRIQQESSPGPRGGIYVEFAVVPTTLLGVIKLPIPRQNGMPAITVHDNVVVQPLGKALSLTALGPVSVTDNQFTSRGVIANADSLASRVSTVSIINLGISDELYLQQLMTLIAISQGKTSYDPATAAHMVGQDGLDDRVLGRSLTSGNVMVNDNQIVCDLLGTPVYNYILSSVLIFSLDDIGFQNNQCDCNLDLISGYDLVLFPVFMLGLSVRMSDNRMKEGLFNAPISAFSWGLFMNSATGNQATHCLLVRKAVLPDRTIKDHNIVFIDPTGKGFCEAFRVLEGD